MSPKDSSALRLLWLSMMGYSPPRPDCTKNCIHKARIKIIMQIQYDILCCRASQSLQRPVNLDAKWRDFELPTPRHQCKSTLWSGNESATPEADGVACCASECALNHLLPGLPAWRLASAYTRPAIRFTVRYRLTEAHDCVNPDGWHLQCPGHMSTRYTAAARQTTCTKYKSTLEHPKTNEPPMQQ